MSGTLRGRGRGRRIGRGRIIQSRWKNYYVNTNNKKGLCESLGERLYTYIDKKSSEKMRTTLTKIVKHASIVYGQDIRKYLHSRKVDTIYKPQHKEDVLDHH